MKISYNWLSEFIELDRPPAEVSLILTNIGLEVESLENVQPVEGGLEGLVIGLVKSCRQHPNADRLHITTVTVGGETDLQIVCGAPNVAAGQKVVVAVPGTTLYPKGAEPFRILKSKIRGEISEGMLCAEDEIGMGTGHTGIIVLDDSAVPGTPVKDWFGLQDDYVFEIGLTPNRADAASHLGVARDLAAFFRKPVKSADNHVFADFSDDLPIPVVVENGQACPRYSSLSIRGVKVSESPGWLKERLLVIGVRPINNIVDVTNYVLHGLGQPLHAFDAGKIKGGKVVVKNCAANTRFTTLDGVERRLSEEDLMICNAEEPMCIAGVFGGLESGITEETVDVFLESAYFDAVSVRKTSRRHGIKTDASFRFERGTDPEMTVFALKTAAQLIVEVAGGRIVSEISDFYPSPKAHVTIPLSYRNVNRLIGKVIPVSEIREIIRAGGIRILSENEEGLLVSVPPYKVDVTREVDVIEEILRMYGYNNIELRSQIRASLNYSPKPDPERVRSQAADFLSSNGFFEILTNSLTSSDFSIDRDTAVSILNPLSNELDTMRQTLLFSGLEVIAFNQKRKVPDLKIYEFGKVYRTKGEGYSEGSRLSLFLSGSKFAEQWNTIKGGQSFYNMKSAVDALLRRFAIGGLTVTDAADDTLAYGIAYRKNDKELAVLGEVSRNVLKTMDIDGEVFYAAINWDLLLKILEKNKITYQEVSRFPAVRRDLSILVDRDVTFAGLEKIARQTEKNLLKEIAIFDVYQGKNLGSGKKSYALSFILQDDEKTLTDKQIDMVMQKLIVNFGREAGAEVRK
jgi:phenylalanyl-tRNA synthetase beta chain